MEITHYRSPLEDFRHTVLLYEADYARYRDKNRMVFRRKDLRQYHILLLDQ
jgi:hypothetical protein